MLMRAWTISPSLLTEYWGNPDATARTCRDGWFLTGDIGHTDEEGYVYVDDRAKDIVVVGSSNVYPADVERCTSPVGSIKHQPNGTPPSR